jgi:hypothetical protein
MPAAAEAAYGTTATLHEAQWKMGASKVPTTLKPSGTLAQPRKF